MRPDRSAIARLRSGPVASPRRVPFAVRSATAAVFRAGGTAHGRPLVRLVVGAAPRPARRRRLRSRMRAVWLGRNTSRRHPACLRGASGVPFGPGRLPSPRRSSRPVRYRPCRPFTVQARDACTYPSPLYSLCAVMAKNTWRSGTPPLRAGEVVWLGRLGLAARARRPCYIGFALVVSDVAAASRRRVCCPRFRPQRNLIFRFRPCGRGADRLYYFHPARRMRGAVT